MYENSSGSLFSTVYHCKAFLRSMYIVKRVALKVHQPDFVVPCGWSTIWGREESVSSKVSDKQIKSDKINLSSLCSGELALVSLTMASLILESSCSCSQSISLKEVLLISLLLLRATLEIRASQGFSGNAQP